MFCFVCFSPKRKSQFFSYPTKNFSCKNWPTKKEENLNWKCGPFVCFSSLSKSNFECLICSVRFDHPNQTKNDFLFCFKEKKFSRRKFLPFRNICCCFHQFSFLKNFPIKVKINLPSSIVSTDEKKRFNLWYFHHHHHNKIHNQKSIQIWSNKNKPEKPEPRKRETFKYSLLQFIASLKEKEKENMVW